MIELLQDNIGVVIACIAFLGFWVAALCDRRESLARRLKSTYADRFTKVSLK